MFVPFAKRCHNGAMRFSFEFTIIDKTQDAAEMIAFHCCGISARTNHLVDKCSVCDLE